MIKKILAILAAIGAFFSAVFFVLFKQAKIEKDSIEKENENNLKKLHAEQKAEEIYQDVLKTEKEEKEKDEELKIKAHSGNKLDNFTAGIDRLCK